MLGTAACRDGVTGEDGEIWREWCGDADVLVLACRWCRTLNRQTSTDDVTLLVGFKASNTKTVSSFQALCRSPDGLSSDDEPTSCSTHRQTDTCN